MLTVSNITFRYPRNRKNTLEDFSLTLQSGNIYGLLGKNGAGKSTLLYLMCGLLTPQKGSATIDGTPVRKRLPEIMQQIFLVPEEFILPETSLKTYVKMNACFYPSFSMDDMRRHLQNFEMDEDLHLGQLSMGQKKKVFISFALATNTPYLIMDEPTNGLDIMGKSQFRKTVTGSMDEGKCIVISTHQVRDIDQVLDHVVIVDNSRLLLQASTQRICHELQCTESFDPELAKQALYAQPSLNGNQLLLPNPEHLDTVLNLELLFGAAITRPEEIARLFPVRE